jgi:hypothetical protein
MVAFAALVVETDLANAWTAIEKRILQAVC